MSASPPQPAVSAPEERPAAAALNSEFELLLACCSDTSQTQRKERLRAILQQPLDWERFGAIAEHHGLIPQACEVLSSCPGLVPAEPSRSIRELYDWNARRALWLSRELVRIVQHLDSRNISTLPYKGPVLAESLYGNVARRQFSDLDILIHAQDLPRIKTALLELGFQPGISLTPREERAYLRSAYEFTFDSTNGKNLLELQWQILPRFYSVEFDIDGLFDRAIDQRMTGLTVRSLSAEDLLLVLCVHAAKHAWIQLSWLQDIAALTKSANLDWSSAWKQSRALGIQRMVAVTFTLMRRLLGSAPPPGAPSDPHAQTLADEIIPLIIASVPYQTESIAYFRLMGRLRERSRDRTRFWWRLATTPNTGEWSAIRLPAPLFPLYRVVRAARLARRIF